MAREEGIATWYKGVGPNVVRGVSYLLLPTAFTDLLAPHERIPDWRVSLRYSLESGCWTIAKPQVRRVQRRNHQKQPLARWTSLPFCRQFRSRNRCC